MYSVPMLLAILSYPSSAQCSFRIQGLALAIWDTFSSRFSGTLPHSSKGSIDHRRVVCKWLILTTSLIYSFVQVGVRTIAALLF